MADSRANAVRIYRVTKGSAHPAATEEFVGGLSLPYGIAFYPPGPNPRWVHVGNDDSLVRIPYTAGDLKAAGKPERIAGRIPWTHHWTRDVVISGDGTQILYSVGSGSNVALDMFPMPLDMSFEEFKKTRPLGATWDTEERRADVLSFDPDGSNERIVETGLRNCSGMTIQPATRQLWCVVNERDGIGGDTPFEYATSVREGASMGGRGSTSAAMRTRATRARGRT